LKPLRQAKHGDRNRRGVVTKERPHWSNAGRKKRGLWRTTTMTRSPLPREKAVGRGSIEGPGVTNLGVVVTKFGKVIEKFERAPCARTSLAPIARIAAARALRASVRIVANMIANPSNAPRCITQTTYYYRA
jgi:hypothetical protein